MSLLLALSLTFVLFTRAENTKNTAKIGQILALAIERAFILCQSITIIG